jgi:ferredoxin-NADP reductase
MSTGNEQADVTVTDVVTVNELVKRFHFRAHATAASCRPSPAAPMSSSRCATATSPRLNPYSLMSSPLDTRDYTISVRRDDVGRGGSLFMHGRVEPG